MQAKSVLEVKPDMRMTVTLEMTVEEADALLRATESVNQWPMFRLKEVFKQALSAARRTHTSEHVTE